MNSYEEKQAARKARLEAAADRAEERANDHFDRSDMSESRTGIPLGQPILVGHHSERRHRKAIERAHNAMRRAAEENERAKELRRKAASVGKSGISSDDPEAVTKLETKLNKLQTLQSFMVAMNKDVRKAIKMGGAENEDAVKAVATAIRKLRPDISETKAGDCALNLLTPDFAGRYGFAPFLLSNNNAEIKRLEKRIKTLKARRAGVSKTTHYDGFTLVENVEANRIQFLFDGKPDEETRKIMKSKSYRWAPSQQAWQRQLTPNARYCLPSVLEALNAVRED